MEEELKELSDHISQQLLKSKATKDQAKFLTSVLENVNIKILELLECSYDNNEEEELDEEEKYNDSGDETSEENNGEELEEEEIESDLE